MMTKAEIGRSGEKFTAEYMKQQGLTILSVNYHSRYGEIDIIASSPEYIIFTEVKTRKQNSLTTPAEAVNKSKQAKIILTAEQYILNSASELQPRFDVAEVTYCINNSGKTIFKINYIENAF